MKPIRFQNVGVAIDKDEAIFVDGDLYVFLCAKCDSTHLMLHIDGRITVSMAMDVGSAELVAKLLLNPPPQDGVNKS